MLERKTASQLNKLRREAISTANFNMLKEGFFRGVLKAAFIRSFEFASFVHRSKIDEADEGSFFVAAALRGVCEDLITLKFIRQLRRKERDEVIQAKMMLAVDDAVTKQAAFFLKNRPFQPVLAHSFDPTRLLAEKDRLTVIGQQSTLWNTQRKLPPVEQMAIRVKLKPFYDFMYAVTSEIVHFNVRIALRSGWGELPRRVQFSTRNFSRYYLEFSQFYSIYLLSTFCRVFRNDLRLSNAFMKVIAEMRLGMDDRLRWPEAVTYEEMNRENPNEIIRIVLKVAHLEKARKRQKHG